MLIQLPVRVMNSDLQELSSQLSRFPCPRKEGCTFTVGICYAGGGLRYSGDICGAFLSPGGVTCVVLATRQVR